MDRPDDAAPAVERRLAAVLCADVEGFSRMCGQDEAGTLGALKKHLDEVIKPTISSNSGRITNYAGDEVVAEFTSAVAAVRAAISIQVGMQERNTLRRPQSPMRFRIGLNLSEVVVQGQEIFGDGVNIAARTQAMAEPGGICATEAVILQVRGKVAASFVSLGKIALKNIAEPVHLYRVVHDDLPADATRNTNVGTNASVNSGSPRPSIAVLPFMNIGDDQEQGYFCDGFAEDLITDLSRFRTLSVIARNSSFVYRSAAVDVKQVGKELGVEFVVEGSLRRMLGSLRINVQLIRADTRHHVWADRYDTPLPELFAMQDKIIGHIVGNLIPRVEDDVLASARKQPTKELRAYDYYLRGKSALYAATNVSGLNEARSLLEEAVTLDPGFAYPYCYLAMILNTLAIYGSPGQDLAPLREQAWSYAKLAELLDDSDPHTHTCLAWGHLWRGEFPAARQHLERAEQLNPNDADRAMDRGSAWMYLGDVDRALDCMQTGMRLSPHRPASYVADLAEAYFVAFRYREMLTLLEQIPDQSLITAAWKAAGYARDGNSGLAHREARRFVANMEANWVGEAGAGETEYVAWFVSFCPFARSTDRQHLISALQLAGLPAPLK